MNGLFEFLIELDKLKSVTRTAYVTDQSRHENSAEHSWHIALALLVLKEELDMDIDVLKALKMSLIHDICEIGAGDVSVFDPQRSKIAIEEKKYMDQLSSFDVKFVAEIQSLWEEFEAQLSAESRWVKVVDRMLPFMLSFANEGRAWKEHGVRKSQVLEINTVVKLQSPEIYRWISDRIEEAVAKGWLIDG